MCYFRIGVNGEKYDGRSLSFGTTISICAMLFEERIRHGVDNDRRLIIPEDGYVT